MKFKKIRHTVNQKLRRITDLQHEFLKEIITIPLVHLEADQSLQILLLQGPCKILRDMRDTFGGLKGAKPATTSTAISIPNEAERPYLPSGNPEFETRNRLMSF